MSIDHSDLHTPLTDLLLRWLPTQRWFASKGSQLREVHVETLTPLMSGSATSPHVDHLVLGVDLDDRHERYQLLLGRRAGTLEERLQHAVIGDLQTSTAYDAVHDPVATRALLTELSTGGVLGGLVFTNTEPVDADLLPRVMTAEQSNTSVVFGDQVILKLFRRLVPGLNPDLEVTKALVDAGSAVVPRPLAWFEGTVADTVTTLGLLQSFLPGTSDGWSMATASVRDLLAEADLRADEVGGDFAGEAYRLGWTTAEVHTAMARALPTRRVGAQDFAATRTQLHARLDAAVEVVPELGQQSASLRALYNAFGTHTPELQMQRVHGDLHLGQVLRTHEGWVLLDFEGEPARSLAERTALMSPLRDVAGMLRSFDYAAHHLLSEGGQPSNQLAYRAQEWAHRSRNAFCAGYLDAGGIDPREDPMLLKVFELDKAVYEVLYEARNRPGWLPVPLGSIARIVEDG